MDSFTFVQSQSSFHKSNTTIRSIGPQFTKPRKIGSIQLYTRRQKLRSSMPLDPRISMRHLRFTCTYMPPHACRRMWRHWWCHLLLWFDAFIRFNLHLWPKSKPPTQKKKKKKKLWPKLIFDLKSKFSKQTYPTRFFVYILILGFVSSSKIWELCKWFNFQKVYFCINLNQK